MADYSASRPVRATRNHPSCKKSPPHQFEYLDARLSIAGCPKCIAEDKAKDDANKKRFPSSDPRSPMFSKWFDDLSHEERKEWLKKNGNKRCFQDWLKIQRFSKKPLAWNYGTQNVSTIKKPSIQPKQKKSVPGNAFNPRTGTTTQAYSNILVRKPTTSKRGKGQGTRDRR